LTGEVSTRNKRCVREIPGLSFHIRPSRQWPAAKVSSLPETVIAMESQTSRIYRLIRPCRFAIFFLVHDTKTGKKCTK
jgi:hypothetical protein